MKKIILMILYSLTRSTKAEAYPCLKCSNYIHDNWVICVNMHPNYNIDNQLPTSSHNNISLRKTLYAVPLHTGFFDCHNLSNWCNNWSDLKFISLWPNNSTNILLIVIKSWTNVLDITLEVQEEFIGGAAVVEFQNKV